MEIKEIQLDLIDIDVDQPRKKARNITELANSILRHGQLEPIKLIEKKDKRYLVEDGERRYLAFRFLEKKTIKAIINQNKGNRLIRQLITNFQKNKLNPIEQSDAVLRLGKEGYSAEEIKANLGISPQKYNLLRKMQGLTVYTRREILAGRLTMNMLDHISKHNIPKEREEDIVKYIIQKKKKSAEQINKTILQKSDIRYNVRQYLDESFKFYTRTKEMNVLLNHWSDLVDSEIKDAIKSSNTNLKGELEVIKERIEVILKDMEAMVKNGG